MKFNGSHGTANEINNYCLVGVIEDSDDMDGLGYKEFDRQFCVKKSVKKKF